jgi:myosin-5
VEIGFSSFGKLEGAAVRTYLLERSRVVHVAHKERSFHAFYQVLVTKWFWYAPVGYRSYLRG